MFKKIESLDELKKTIYKWILPCLIFALLINTIMQSDSINFLNNTLTIWFIISWIFLYKNCFIRFAEYTNLALISLYHVYTVFDMSHNYMAKIGSGSLGDFIVWTPLFFMFIFLTLGTKRGFYFSIGIFLITLIPGIIDFNRFSSESLDSLGQFYFANIVYILVLYYAQHIFRTYAEVEVLKKHVYIDSLTRIANRHRIDEWLEKKMKESIEKHESFSIIFFDIDYFKKVNDIYGHKIGDSVLKELASLITNSLSTGDLFGRWGGEEFIIITNAKSNDAVLRAEHFRKRIEAYKFKGVKRLTASFGVTEFQPSDTIDTLLTRADEGLYQAKNSGRNLVSKK
jgi:diguanylate cyclase (GGDEF)-like protein